MNLDEARAGIGRGVVYTPRNLDGRPLLHKREDGVITSVSDRFVFVRYAGQHPTAAGQATEPDRLEFAT